MHSSHLCFCHVLCALFPYTALISALFLPCPLPVCFISRPATSQSCQLCQDAPCIHLSQPHTASAHLLQPPRVPVHLLWLWRRPAFVMCSALSPLHQPAFHCQQCTYPCGPAPATNLFPRFLCLFITAPVLKGHAHISEDTKVFHVKSRDRPTWQINKCKKMLLNTKSLKRKLKDWELAYKSLENLKGSGLVAHSGKFSISYGLIALNKTFIYSKL